MKTNTFVKQGYCRQQVCSVMDIQALDDGIQAVAPAQVVLSRKEGGLLLGAGDDATSEGQERCGQHSKTLSRPLLSKSVGCRWAHEVGKSTTDTP